MTIKVTQEDIDKGKPKDTWNCPIARALFRATGWKWVVRANDYYRLAPARLYAELPECARQFVSDFDEYRVVRPFEFEIEFA